MTKYDALIDALEWQNHMGAMDCLNDEVTQWYSQHTQNQEKVQRQKTTQGIPQNQNQETARQKNHSGGHAFQAKRPSQNTKIGLEAMPRPLHPSTHPLSKLGQSPKTDLSMGLNEALKVAQQLASAAKNLEMLAASAHQFEGMPLKRTAMHTVFGDGNPKSQLMFIGEAPGSEEDRQGVPFVGKSGKLLDKILSYIGLDRGQFYITNAIYWRPPGNRTPTNTEIQLCRPFLERQIHLIKPKIIVTVGGASTKALLQKGEGITRMRGKWSTYSLPESSASIPVFPIFHPSYLLRTPAAKDKIWQDCLALHERLLSLGLAKPLPF